MVTVSIQVPVEADDDVAAVTAAVVAIRAGEYFDIDEDDARAEQADFHTMVNLYDGTLKRPTAKRGGVVVFVSGLVNGVTSWAEITSATPTMYRAVDGRRFRRVDALRIGGERWRVGSAFGSGGWIEPKERARLIHRFGRV